MSLCWLFSTIFLMSITVIKKIKIMTQFSTNTNVSKLPKLKNLLENLKHKSSQDFAVFRLKKQGDKKTSQNTFLKHLDVSQDFSLYLSLTEKPLTLLFSMDQFFFEFSKKNYQQNKSGEFLRQLKERKKLSFFYGECTKKQLNGFFVQAKKTKGNLSRNVLSLLERKLDVVLYRSGLTKTTAEARQLIKHKKILVNQNRVNIPSFLVNPGDIISTSQDPSLSDSLENSSSVFYKKTNTLQKQLSRESDKFKNTRDKPANQPNFLKHSFNPALKSICGLCTKTLCTRIKWRCDFHLKKHLHTPTELLTFSKCQNSPEKTVLLGLKWKFFKKMSLFRKTSLKHNFTYANCGSLQQKPQFWNLVQKAATNHQYKQHRQKNRLNWSLAFYRKGLQVFFTYLENHTRFFGLLTLNRHKSFLQNKHTLKFSRNLTFRVYKPLHLEVSYAVLSLVYLYSPQKVNFPFSIDVDLIYRSLR